MYRANYKLVYIIDTRTVNVAYYNDLRNSLVASYIPLIPPITGIHFFNHDS